jgi:hypothetical protein
MERGELEKDQGLWRGGRGRIDNVVASCGEWALALVSAAHASGGVEPLGAYGISGGDGQVRAVGEAGGTMLGGGRLSTS